MLEEIDSYLEIQPEYTGGNIDTTRSAQKYEIIGGYAANYSVGNNALYKIRSNIMDWKMLPKHLSKQRKIQTVNDILNLGRFISNPKALCAIIKEIYNLPDKDLIKALSKSLDLHESLDIAFRKLYYVWCDLMEFATFVLLEQEGIAAEAPILSHLANNEELEGSPIKPKLLDKIRKYEHKGYCPREPVKRITNLFTFPLNDIIAEVKAKDPTFMIGVDLNDVYQRITDIVKQINIESRKEIVGIKNRKPLPDIKETDSSKQLSLYVDMFIDLYRIALPALKQQEKKNIALSKSLLKVCKAIESIIINMH